MLCPRCQLDLQTINLKGTNIDICPTCQGIFLDKGEILKLIEINRNELKLIDTTVETNFKPEEKLWQDEIACPRCHKLMQKFPYAGSTNIIIDSCQNGCGIWLDKGEIFKIADFLTTAKQPLDDKEQKRIRELLKTTKQNQPMNIWELLGKRYDISENSQEEMMSDLDSSNEGKYITIIFAVLQGIIYFLFRKVGF